MKNRHLYCPSCHRNTLHIGEETEPLASRALMRFMTMGMLSTSTIDYYCDRCGECNYTYQPSGDRFTWAREGTDVEVDCGTYSYHT